MPSSFHLWPFYWKAKLRHASVTPVRKLSPSCMSGQPPPFSFHWSVYWIVHLKEYKHKRMCPLMNSVRMIHESGMSLSTACKELALIPQLFWLHTSQGITLETCTLCDKGWEHREGVLFAQSQSVLESVQPQFPVFSYTNNAESNVFEFGRITSPLKPAILQYFYRDLTGDASAASNYGGRWSRCKGQTVYANRAWRPSKYFWPSRGPVSWKKMTYDFA